MKLVVNSTMYCQRIEGGVKLLFERFKQNGNVHISFINFNISKPWLDRDSFHGRRRRRKDGIRTEKRFKKGWWEKITGEWGLQDNSRIITLIERRRQYEE